MRLKLTGEPVSQAKRSEWLSGIDEAWNNKFHIEGPGKLKLVFHPHFTESRPHQTITVTTGNDPDFRPNATNWDLNMGKHEAAHEFGHLVGNPDEYRRTAADFRKIIGRDPEESDKLPVPYFFGYTDFTSIMGHPHASHLKLRHVVAFLNWLNMNKSKNEAFYELAEGP